MHGTESDFEQTTLDRLIAVGYKHINGGTIKRPDEREVIRKQPLLDFLYNNYPDEVAELAFKAFTSPEGVDRTSRNQNFLHSITRGKEIAYEDKEANKKVVHVYPIDWEDPENNTFKAVNQLTIKGRIERRPDIIIYIKGLPLVIFELKNQ